MSGWQIKDRIQMPEPLGCQKVARREHQHWQRIDRAEGELDLGYDAVGWPVRVEYHWIRYFSRANPKVADVYTAELWVRQKGGGWLYLLPPGQERFVELAHADVRRLLATELNIDVGD